MFNPYQPIRFTRDKYTAHAFVDYKSLYATDNIKNCRKLKSIVLPDFQRKEKSKK